MALVVERSYEAVDDPTDVRRDEGGLWHIRAGATVRVRVTMVADSRRTHVALIDPLPAGLEPLNVLSGYRYQDGLGYYESTRDAATHFFFGYLPKGTYVFEYPLRVNHAGAFSNGIATIQAMYAPEFTAHSEGIRLRVGPSEGGPMIGER